MQRTVPQNPFIPPKDGRCLINNLPVELLTHIFILGAQSNADDTDVEQEMEFQMDEEDEDEDEDAYDETQLPWELLVSRVCQFWRDAAIKTAYLWTDLEFNYGIPNDRHEAYIERSQGAPLNVDIEDDLSDADEDEGDVVSDPYPVSRIEAALDLVLPHVARWKSFRMQVSSYAAIAHTLERLCDCPAAPQLEELVLSHYGEDDEDDEDLQMRKLSPFDQPDAVLFHGNVPSLKVVTLWGVPLNWPQCHFLRGLTELELAYHADCLRPSYHDFLRIISESPELSQLKLLGSGPSIAFPGQNKEPLPLSNLKLLALKHILPQEAEFVVARMAAPNLTGLELDLETDVPSGSLLLKALSEPHPLVKHSIFSKLESLKLSAIDCDRDAVTKTYGALKNVQRLHLNFNYLGDDWLGQLYLPQEAQCPLLTSISITGLDVCFICTLVEGRIQKGLSLKELRIERESSSTPDEMEFLATCVERLELFEDSDDETDEEDEEDEDEN